MKSSNYRPGSGCTDYAWDGFYNVIYGAVTVASFGSSTEDDHDSCLKFFLLYERDS